MRVSYLFVRAFFIVGVRSGHRCATSWPRRSASAIRTSALSYTLTSIAAAVLGGASLLGGRGSFLGAVVGALFLNVIINVLPFLGWSASYGQIMVGVLTLLALTFYQAPELMARIKTFIANFRLRVAAPPRSSTRPEPRGATTWIRSIVCSHSGRSPI